MFGFVLKVLPTGSADTGDMECVVCAHIHMPTYRCVCKRKKKQNRAKDDLSIFDLRNCVSVH